MRLPLFAALLLSIIATPAVAAPPLSTLTPFVASYEVTLNNLPFKASARQTLVPLGNDRWRLELRVESFLLDTLEYSEFRWDGENCHTIPDHYAYTRKGIGKKKHLDLRFDHARRIVTRNDGKTVTTFTSGERTEDKIGHTLAIACRIARGERGSLTLDVAWDRDVRPMDYVVAMREENVSTPLGVFRALRMERKRSDSDRVTRSWVAENSGWQAVQMQHTEGDGRLFQLRLLEIQHASQPR